MRSYIKAMSVPLRGLQQRSRFVVRQPRCSVTLKSGFKSENKRIQLWKERTLLTYKIEITIRYLDWSYSAETHCHRHSHRQ